MNIRITFGVILFLLAGSAYSGPVDEFEHQYVKYKKFGQKVAECLDVVKVNVNFSFEKDPCQAIQSSAELRVSFNNSYEELVRLSNENMLTDAELERANELIELIVKMSEGMSKNIDEISKLTQGK